MGACAVDLVGNLAGMTVRVRRRAVNAWTPEERNVGAAIAGGVALDAMAVASQLLEAATTAESALEAGQLARAAKDAAVVAGIMTDKACLLAGEPTVRVERVDPVELRVRLDRLLHITR
jgi:hypothetical protein